MMKLQSKEAIKSVQLFVPCFIDQLYPQVAMSMVAVLQHLGIEAKYNPNQTCCGQPAFNAGFWGDAKEVCSKFISDFSGDEYVVAPSASCIGFVRNYYTKLFDNSSVHNGVKFLAERSYEFSDFVVNVLGVTDMGARMNTTVTYHDSCAALRECNIKQAPRQLLAAVAGLELVEMNDVETCCGFGGTFAVKFEPISVAMGDQKIDNATATKAEYLVSTDMSCLMHLQGVADNKQAGIKTMHLAELLAKAIT
ncbi:MAG: (Fe-S)-binding protein [Chitinophagaceae bacterium]